MDSWKSMLHNLHNILNPSLLRVPIVLGLTIGVDIRKLDGCLCHFLQSHWNVLICDLLAILYRLLICRLAWSPLDIYSIQRDVFFQMPPLFKICSTHSKHSSMFIVITLTLGVFPPSSCLSSGVSSIMLLSNLFETCTMLYLNQDHYNILLFTVLFASRHAGC